jgi:Derlin-2/3
MKSVIFLALFELLIVSDRLKVSVDAKSLSSSFFGGTSSSTAAGRRRRTIALFNNNHHHINHWGHKKEDNSITLDAILGCRGGEESDDEDDGDESDVDDDSDDESDEEESDDAFGNLAEADDSEDDFRESNFAERMLEQFQNAPPFTKQYLLATFVAGIAGMALSGNQFPPILALDWNKVFKGFQIWRPITAFLNFGPMSIWQLLTAQFIFDYMGGLERLYHNKPYDYWIMILFGMISMVVVYPALKLDSRFLGHNLSTYVVYVWSRMHEGTDVRVLEFLTMKAHNVPWFMLFQVCISILFFLYFQLFG